MDLAIVVFPINLVWGLQMQNSMKFWVLVGFGLRLPYVCSDLLYRRATQSFLATPTNSSRLIPIAIMRLKTMRNSLSRNDYLLAAAMTEYYTQAEMTFSLIAATIPCLRMFMEAAKTGLLGISMWAADTSTYSYTRSYARNEPGTTSQTRSTMPKRHEASDVIQLRDWNQGSSSARAHASSDKVSVASDSSETAIIVRQNVDVSYD